MFALFEFPKKINKKGKANRLPFRLFAYLVRLKHSLQ
jgi:hypothetical protein